MGFEKLTSGAPTSPLPSDTDAIPTVLCQITAACPVFPCTDWRTILAGNNSWQPILIIPRRFARLGARLFLAFDIDGPLDGVAGAWPMCLGHALVAIRPRLDLHSGARFHMARR